MLVKVVSLSVLIGATSVVNGMAAVNRALSVITEVNGEAVSVPVVTTASNSSITVTFDLDEPDMRYLAASVTALNPDGTLSRMTPDEYLDSFNRADVTDADFSQATLSHYTNYRFTLSRDNLMPSRSGLFRLDFVDTDNISDTVLSVPFYMVVPLASIDHTLSPVTDISYNNGQRQLTLTCDLAGRFHSLDPDNLSLTVMIDGRTAASAVKPSAIHGNKVGFNHLKELIFDNGNNWRRFDMTDTDYPGHGITDIITTHDGNHRFLLNRDTPRALTSYMTDGTMFGGFTVANRLIPDNPVTGSEYCDVVFTLDMPFRPLDPVAVEGDFTRYMPGGVLAMSFNSFTGLYEATARLKQGVYNYRYLSGQPLSPTSIEGNFNETPARFDLLLFYKSPVERYPALIGHKSFTCQL